MSKARELLGLLEQKKIKFFLNGDGMTNVHPEKDTVDTGRDKWFFEFKDKDFKNYLKEKDIYLKGKDILDKEDDYKYGEVVN